MVMAGVKAVLPFLQASTCPHPYTIVVRVYMWEQIELEREPQRERAAETESRREQKERERQRPQEERQSEIPRERATESCREWRINFLGPRNCSDHNHFI